MSKTILSIGCAVLCSVVSLAQAPAPSAAIKTFCNPLDLPYHFQPEGPTRREAADPLIVLYQDKYWLFASKQIGYWWSDDLLRWHLVKPTGLPLDVYAPAVAVVDGKLIYFAGEDKGSFVTDDPLLGSWVQVSPFKRGANDPAIFQDDDGKVYLYDGCSDKTPLRVTELDRRSFLPLTERGENIAGHPDLHGWEVPGDSNTLYGHAPWIEGSWMNKIKGRYYWQYAGPGTQFKTYGDGVYVSDKPTGPFVYQSYSPFSFKPTGFIAGAGHSATFADLSGDYWHIGTGTISIRHMFERRLMLFPTGIMDDGQLVTNTYLGDYPQLAPGTAANHLMGNEPGWMLLSYHKPAKASSEAGQQFAVQNAFDEEIRSWWSAATGNAGEWLRVDLEKKCRINAIQINFADQGAEQHASLGAEGYQYYVEVSLDGDHWVRVIDHSREGRDAPHDYEQLDSPVMARYVRITNVHEPAHGLFSLSDLRVFGSAMGKLPAMVKGLVVMRDADGRTAHVQWKGSTGADFYIVRYGIAPDRLFGNYQVYDATHLDIHSLNAGVKYYFTVDAVNGTGVMRGEKANTFSTIYEQLK